MEKEQISLLLALAKRLRKEENSEKLALERLNSAGILTKEGRVTKSFPNLQRVLSTVG